MSAGSGEPEQQALFGWSETLPEGAAPAPVRRTPFRDTPEARRMLDVREVYAEPAALDSPRGQQIMSRLSPDVRVTEVDGHWRIPSLHGNDGNIGRWVRIKNETLVLGVKHKLATRPNGRSADWIAPGPSNGCAMACAYCYVPRRKGFANPITLFTNIEAIVAHVRRHVRAQGPKTEPNQCDPRAWVYDIGENGDCSVDALVSDNTADLVAAFRSMPTAKASFATKFVNPDLLALDPQGRTRVRFSVMPPGDARLLDIRTSPVADRIAAAADFLDAGYEVHFNLSPVVLRPGWQRDWAELLVHLDDVLPARVKEQAAAEIIMLTHNAGLHEVNLGWHPKAEELLWQPDAQETKRSQNGALNVRYSQDIKRQALARLHQLLAEHAPWLRVRYAF
ncbi:MULTISPECIES: spore photoproduct lyase family protein [unclassified Streptomyces]|uniref:spore photoproduct lyase family protein n=1 Tax=unclassified Streptomyces TaxID=2593676 RepID=UPI00136FDB26|nr:MULTISPECIES: spore photoproduct lyase family protein [unclassified Streptomyces]NEA04066.1 spore photoproduct lyase family protein [Streptomyces sp. SID10116]MYY81233.1 spore photoproduct lyase family protein [Streptomyces sp. SID335]MYZ19359.1 spore photoproduct lyase family protein [Streptomyces sp. SID337]NDZ88542.1 spore photoproduct lyase family protein [Streptomyces sp. SID10115]NEB50486.1 spore photoproduct lyase family protein [Streptomyces sp. SID339]